MKTKIIRKVGLLLGATVLLSTLYGCGSRPRSSAVQAPNPRIHANLPGERQALLRVASELIGSPYRYGGNTPRGFDCSGLVQFSHREIGIKVPRTASTQWTRARIPNRQDLVPGDLLFFNIDAGKNRHVAIYEGDGVFIHAPSSGKRVSRSSLDNPFWRDRYIGARTFL